MIKVNGLEIAETWTEYAVLLEWEDNEPTPVECDTEEEAQRMAASLGQPVQARYHFASEWEEIR